MKKFRKQSFTLIELLVSMAVFSILLVISMRLFSGAQRLWLRSEQKTNAFADARISMEFLASRIQSLYYTENVPFYIYDKRSGSGFSDNRSEIWFASKMPFGNNLANSLSGTRFIKFALVDPTDTSKSDAGKLQMSVYSGRENTGRNFWMYLFPPYGDENRYFSSAASAFSWVDGKLSPSVVDSDDVYDIIENVVDFKLSWHNAIPEGASGWKLEKLSSGTTRDQKTPPYMVEMEISLMDSRESFIKWQDAEAGSARDAVFAENGYVFRRAVLTGKRFAE